MSKTQNLPKIMVDQCRFDFELGLKIIKAKHKTLKTFEDSGYISPEALKIVRENWDTVGNVTVMEALSIPNLESRRICFRYIGVDTIFKELNPELVDDQTINKTTKVNAEGKLEAFDDNYKLYKVKGTVLTEGVQGARQVQDFFILRCQCTSTAREYLIYIQDIWISNRWGAPSQKDRKPDAIEAVAWTIQVEVPETHVDYIVRAGDAIMVKAKPDYKKCPMRHLSKTEYLEKLKMES